MRLGQALHEHASLVVGHQRKGKIARSYVQNRLYVRHKKRSKAEEQHLCLRRARVRANAVDATSTASHMSNSMIEPHAPAHAATYEYISSHFSLLSVCGSPETNDTNGGWISSHTCSKFTYQGKQQRELNIEAKDTKSGQQVEKISLHALGQSAGGTLVSFTHTGRPQERHAACRLSSRRCGFN